MAHNYIREKAPHLPTAKTFNKIITTKVFFKIEKMPSVSQGHSNSFNKSFFFWFLRLSNEPPNPFPKQTHTKTHAGTNNCHYHCFNNICRINSRKNCKNSSCQSSPCCSMIVCMLHKIYFQMNNALNNWFSSSLYSYFLQINLEAILQCK